MLDANSRVKPGLKAVQNGTAISSIRAAGADKCELSIVVPIYNEVESIPYLVEQLYAALNAFGRSFEIIMIDDGSSDGSNALLQKIATTHPDLKVVTFVRNFGQTAAMMAGFDFASGKIIVTLDADLQNDPADISTVVAKIDEGYDLCSGWRKNREDAKIRRNFVSRVANSLISRTSGVRLHDYGCTLKAYRRSTFQGIRLYGEMHRFIPIFAGGMGAKITEVVVRHRPRNFGRSKYGLNRIFKVTLDLLLVQFMHRYMAKPIHLFGGIGILFLAVSFLSLAATIYIRLFHGVPMISTPLPLFSSIFFVLGINTVLLGLIAELLMRTYYESQQRTPYMVRDVANMEKAG